MSLSLGSAKKWLSGVWFTGFGIPFLILLARTFGTSGDSQTSDMWNWFFPTVLPTVSLILGVLVADWKRQPNLTKPADGSLFGLAFALSVLYLVAVIGTLVMSPGLPGAATDLLKRSHVYLAPVQGLAAASLAAFFRK
jgi:hypothetical protein